MVREVKTATTARRKPAPAPARARAPAPGDPRDAMSATELARGILAKEVRPRAGDIRRLAEAVLDGRLDDFIEAYLRQTIGDSDN